MTPVEKFRRDVITAIEKERSKPRSMFEENDQIYCDGLADAIILINRVIPDPRQRELLDAARELIDWGPVFSIPGLPLSRLRRAVSEWET